MSALVLIFFKCTGMNERSLVTTIFQMFFAGFPYFYVGFFLRSGFLTTHGREESSVKVGKGGMNRAH